MPCSFPRPRPRPCAPRSPPETLFPPSQSSRCQLSSPFPPGGSPGPTLARGVGAVSQETVEGPGKVPAGGVGREGRGQCPGPSSAPSRQSQTPSHSRMAPRQVPSTQDTSPGAQSTCPVARERGWSQGTAPRGALSHMPAGAHFSAGTCTGEGGEGGRWGLTRRMPGGLEPGVGTTNPGRTPRQQRPDSRGARRRAGPGAGSARRHRPASPGGTGSPAHPSHLHSCPAHRRAGPGAGSGRSCKTPAPPHSPGWHSLGRKRQAGSGHPERLPQKAPTPETGTPLPTSGWQLDPRLRKWP